MTSEMKAEKFKKEAELHGWAVVVGTGSAGGDHIVVDCNRGDEHINIFWVNNILTETPKYTLAGVTTSLHNAAQATRQLSQKPNLERAYRRTARRVGLKAATVGGSLADPSAGGGSGGQGPEALPIVRHPLPFDLWESTDKEILRALRGSTIVYLNQQLGYALSTRIVKQLNMNLLHFNLVQAGEKPARPTGDRLDPNKGRPIVNFIATDGGFRSVAIEQILQVI